jgi:O-acetyl-ADP-ribose deacetylase (regulator of RNase III)
MIIYVRGDLFESPAQVLVNTVNTVGVMGKGIAKRFKSIYPKMFQEYQDLCERGRLEIGVLHLYKTSHKWILNFPTKRHWRQASRVEDVEAGLRTFVGMYSEAGIHSIAFPALGCGNGQLDYRTQVEPLMRRYLGRLPIDVFVHSARRQASAPEHLDQDTVAEWLRSEPSTLAYEEVARDLRDAIASKRSVRTVKGGSFTAEFEEDDTGTLRVVTDARTYRFSQDDLLEFWQQLRQHGFMYRRIAPSHARVSYLMPVFALLPYVQVVQVSESDEGLVNNAATALQLRAPRVRHDTPNLFSASRMALRRLRPSDPIACGRHWILPSQASPLQAAEPSLGLRRKRLNVYLAAMSTTTPRLAPSALPAGRTSSTRGTPRSWSPTSCAWST